jgi:hypothetical protein
MACVTVGSTQHTQLEVSTIQVSDPEYSRKKGAGPSGDLVFDRCSIDELRSGSADCTPGAAQVPAQTCSGHTCALNIIRETRGFLRHPESPSLGA